MSDTVKVYMVFEDQDYEGYAVHGVCATRERAERLIEELLTERRYLSRERLVIEEWDLLR